MIPLNVKQGIILILRLHSTTRHILLNSQIYLYFLLAWLLFFKNKLILFTTHSINIICNFIYKNKGYYDISNIGCMFFAYLNYFDIERKVCNKLLIIVNLAFVSRHLRICPSSKWQLLWNFMLTKKYNLKFLTFLIAQGTMYYSALMNTFFYVLGRIPEDISNNWF